MSEYIITDFGAIGDGKTMNTKAIQKAIDTCNKEGGGRVICTSGIYKTGSIFLKSNVELYLEKGCKIIGSEDLNDYKELEGSGFNMEKIDPKREMTKHALIIGVEAENISITGNGEINGSGFAFYRNTPVHPETGKFDKPENPRPRIGMFYKCKNVFFEGVTFINSPCWTIWLMKCENVNIHRIKIYGDKKMRNVDGIDVDGCKNVLISDCIIDSEDDCIAIFSIKDFYKDGCVCENISVSNCILKTACNGIRIGCPGHGEIKNCVFNNIIISDSLNGILFEYPKRYLLEGQEPSADVHDIMFNNFIITSKISPITLIVEEGIKIKNLSNIIFSNIDIVKSGAPIIVSGNSEFAIQDIVFENIYLRTQEEQQSFLFKYCKNVRLNNIQL